MDVSIIIVNFNTKDLTAACIQSILQFTSDITYEIILVDNGSSDGSVDFIKSNFDDVLLIDLTTNLGFGKANNIGVEKASGEYVFFLNSDTLLLENSIKKMVDFFRQMPSSYKIGALGCTLIGEDRIPNGSGSHFPNCKSTILENLYQIPPLRLWVSKPQEKNYPTEQVFYEIDYVIGADLMMKKSVFEALGGFYREYFMYFEESDLQYQMQKKLGLKSYIFTGTKIIHLAERSGAVIKNYNNRKRIISRVSKNVYLKRNDAKNFKNYIFIEKFFLFLSKFNSKYSKQENAAFISEVSKTFTNEN